MLRVSLKNLATATRTIVPEYPGLPYACKLHPDWDRSVDILPGTVMTRVEGEFVAPIGVAFGDVTATAQKPFGLAGLFVAPKHGIDECTGTDNFAVWVGESDAVFRIKAPAFDLEATWTNSTNGEKTPVYANAEGLLTTTAGGEIVGTLIDAQVDKGFIRVSLDKHYPAGGSGN